MKYYTKLKLSVLLLLSLFINTSFNSFKKPINNSEILNTLGLIYFKYNSSEFLDSTYEGILRRRFLRLNTLNIQDLEINIRFNLCPLERKKNYLLGYQRAEKVIAYAKTLVSIDKRNFLITDVSEDFVFNGNCKYSGLSIVPSFRE